MQIATVHRPLCARGCLSRDEGDDRGCSVVVVVVVVGGGGVFIVAIESDKKRERGLGLIFTGKI